MPMIVHFDLQVREPAGWRQVKRFAADAQAAAIEEAETMDGGEAPDVRVVRITRFGADRHPVETVEWQPEAPIVTDPPAAPRPTPLAEPPAAVPAVAPAPAKPAPPGPAGPDEEKSSVGFGEIAARVFVGGFVIGVLSVYPVVRIIDAAVAAGWKLTPGLQMLLTVTLVAVIFVIAALVTAFVVGALESRRARAPAQAGAKAAPPDPPHPAPPPAPTPAPVLAPPDPAPAPRDPPAPPAATEPPAPTVPPEPPAPPDGFDLGFAFDYARELPPVALTEAHRNAVLLFLERALIVLTPAVKSMDEATQFGLHLFLAGGAERFGATVGLKNLQKFVLIREAIGSLGTAPDAIEDFCERFIDYDTDEKYRVMTDVGRDIMEMYLDDNHACFAGLPELFERWTGSPVARARALGITAVMVTDITDALEPDDGEAGVPGVVRGHIGAVRRALAEFHGTELHHTGRGIAALFTDAANAIGAAAMVQRDLARHNAGDPVTPLHVRIGIDADAGSDPVAETIDQVTEGAALACAGAEAGEIVVSETALTLGTDDPLAVTGSPRGDPPGSLTAIDWLKEA